MSSTAKLSCVIVEDDPVAEKVLEVLVQKTPSLQLLKSFNNPIEASDFLKKEKVDIAFLDIEMPELSGFDIIKFLNPSISIVIVSTKEQYALEAFSYQVADYLLKPLNDYTRFLKAVYRVQELKEKNTSVKTNEAAPLFVKVDSLLHNLDVNNILWVEANGDYVKINTHQKMLMVLATLKSVEGKLPVNQFVKVHRSYIVNIKQVDNIDPSNLQIGSKIIPVSIHFRDDLINKINLL